MPGKMTRHQFLTYAPSNAETTLVPVGGEVFQFKGAQALNVGDAVYATANAGEVDKNTAQANYATFVGFVVGGRLTNGEVVTSDLTPGAAIAAIPACGAGQEVLVQCSGIGLGISSAAIASGQRVLAENLGTAGRVAAGTTAGLMLGHTVGATTGANQWQKLIIGLR